ncbi:MAG: flagellin, partial [Alphaproteobacteria bacterium]
AEQYLSNNKIVSLRLEAMEISTAKVFEAASKLKTFLVNALSSSNAADFPINLEAQNLLDEVTKQLNFKIGDRYLFGGAVTDVAPVDLNDANFPAVPPVYPSAANTNYYQGDNNQHVARVADEFDVTYGVTADAEGFEQAIRALRMAADASTSPTIDRIRFQEALKVINTAIDNIPTTRSRIGASLKAIEGADLGHNDMELFMERTISDIENVDIPETVAQLANNQVLLEASFMTIGRLSQLNLANFL